MIKKILLYLERIGADQITFRKVGMGHFAHLNIQVEEINNFNQSGNVTITEQMVRKIREGNTKDDLMDEMMLDALRESYNYGLNDVSAFFEETCPNCGAVTGEYEVTTMGGSPDRNKRTCLRCKCTWFGYELTAEMVTKYIKKGIQQ